MNYLSTRGGTEAMGFQDAVLSGLAPDGGLLIPESIPDVSSELEAWAALPYPELAIAVFRHFVDFSEQELRDIVQRSYAGFRDKEVTPLHPLRDGMEVLELWHGPTLAFKDVAMQFLSNCFDHILETRDEQLNILGSTSGDTGSAAIHGVRGKERINIFMMHPKGRTSAVQEKQMTSVLDDNVVNLAVEGTFDDCQRIMKSIFRDLDFKQAHALGAVNSVNWARVCAQIVYYFYAGLKVMRKQNAAQINFAVPTGNFGNVLAGWYAARMGLPVHRLILATNENDILARLFTTGRYASGAVHPTISPSMDIQVASNFERYLYYRLEGDSDALLRILRDFDAKGSVELPLQDGRLDPLFTAGTADTAATLDCIRRHHARSGYLLDPHSAVGVQVAEHAETGGFPTVCLATAHPAKFPEAIRDAIGETPHHPVLDALENAETRCRSLPAEEAAVREVIETHQG